MGISDPPVQPAGAEVKSGAGWGTPGFRGHRELGDGGELGSGVQGRQGSGWGCQRPGLGLGDQDWNSGWPGVRRDWDWARLGDLDDRVTGYGLQQPHLMVKAKVGLSKTQVPNQ